MKSKDSNQPYVLICDDDEGIVDVTKIILEDKGYLVKICTNSDDIIKMIHHQKPAVVLLDLWMPGIGGQEIARMIKRDKTTKTIPVVIISANKDTQRIAVEAGADDFLSKPFDIEELEAVVNKYMPT